MESFDFPGLQHILLQVFFSFSGFQKLERDVAEYITNFPHHTNKISQSNMSQSEKRPKKLTNFIVLERFLVVLQILDLATCVCKAATFSEAGIFFQPLSTF